MKTLAPAWSGPSMSRSIGAPKYSPPASSCQGVSSTPKTLGRLGTGDAERHPRLHEASGGDLDHDAPDRIVDDGVFAFAAVHGSEGEDAVVHDSIRSVVDDGVFAYAAVHGYEDSLSDCLRPRLTDRE